MNLDFEYFAEVKVIQISVEMSSFACKILVFFFLFFLFPKLRAMCFPSNNFSKILSNANKFLQTCCGVNIVVPDPF